MIYTYNKNIDPDKLQREIQSQIEGFQYLNTEGLTVTLMFSIELLPEQVTALNTIVENHNPIDEYRVAVNQILSKQYRASEILAEFYAQNSSDKNEQFYIDFFDVILRLREGDFLGANIKLSQKNPSEFITQSDIDDLSTKIANNM